MVNEKDVVSTVNVKNFPSSARIIFHKTCHPTVSIEIPYSYQDSVIAKLNSEMVLPPFLFVLLVPSAQFRTVLWTFILLQNKSFAIYPSPKGMTLRSIILLWSPFFQTIGELVTIVSAKGSDNQLDLNFSDCRTSVFPEIQWLYISNSKYRVRRLNLHKPEFKFSTDLYHFDRWRLVFK